MSLDQDSPKGILKRYLTVIAVIGVTTLLLLLQPFMRKKKPVKEEEEDLNINGKRTIDQFKIGYQITYTNIYVKSGYSTGTIIGKMDESLLLIDSKDFGEKKLVEISDVKTLNNNKFY